MRRALAALALLSAPAVCGARPLQWADVVAAAERGNPELSAARAVVDSARARVGAARSDFLPQISGNGSYTQSNTATSLESVAQGGGRGGTQDEYSLSLTAQQSLFSGFKSKAGLDSAKAQLNSALSTLALAEANVLQQLRAAFLGVLHGQENVGLLRKIRDRKAENRKLIELRYQGGRENRGAFLRAKAQLAQAEFEATQAERALRAAQRGLARAMGQDAAGPLSVDGNFEVRLDTASPDFAALAQRTPEYLISQYGLAESRAGVWQARSEFFPSLSVSGTGRRRGKDWPPDNDSWNVGASISYPFFPGARNFFGVRQAHAEFRRAAARLYDKRREAELALEDAFVQFQDAAGQAEVQRQFLEAAEERARIARVQYGNGLVTYQDWDLIENDLTNAQKQTLESLRRAALAEAGWAQAQGKGLRAFQ